MEDPSKNHDHDLEPQQVAAKAALLAEYEQLAAAGLTFVNRTRNQGLSWLACSLADYRLAS